MQIPHRYPDKMHAVWPCFLSHELSTQPRMPPSWEKMLLRRLKRVVLSRMPVSPHSRLARRAPGPV